MSLLLKNPQLWALRPVTTGVLVAGLTLGLTPIVFADEGASDSTEEVTPESEPAEEESSPEPEPAEEESSPEPEPAEEESSPEPEPIETYAVVDPETGNVLNIIACTQSHCGEGGEAGGKILDSTSGIVGDLVRQGSGGGYYSSEDTKVTYDGDSESFLVEQESGSDSSTSFRITPKEGADFQVSELESNITVKSGDTAATLKIPIRDPGTQEPNLSAAIEFPDLGEGTVLSYEFGLRPNPAGQVLPDVEAALVENGYNLPEASTDQENGLDTPQPAGTPGSFVTAVLEITDAIVARLSSWFGSNQN